MKASFTAAFFIIFILLFFTAGCQREINWHLPATGTLKDAAHECMIAKVWGTFYNGVAPRKDTAYIELKVDVFTTGTYLISTDMQNGLRFADSGSFTSKGLQTIKLKPIGAALLPINTDYTICFDTSCCPINIAVKNADTTNVPVNSWRYTDVEKGITYSGVINATHFLITPLEGLLSLRTEGANQADTSFEIGLSFPDKNITTGIFKTDSLNAVSLSANGVCVNCAWEVVYKFYGVKSTIIVTDYNPQTKIIKGTFSGTTIDWKSDVAPIKDGIFSAVIR